MKANKKFNQLTHHKILYFVKVKISHVYFQAQSFDCDSVNSYIFNLHYFVQNRQY